MMSLFLTLNISIRCRNIQTNHAKYPLNFINGNSTTALCLPIVAMDPMSLYLYSFKDVPAMIRFWGFQTGYITYSKDVRITSDPVHSVNLVAIG